MKGNSLLQDESSFWKTVSKGAPSTNARPFAQACSVAVPSGDACSAAMHAVAPADAEAYSVAVPSGDACSATMLAVGDDVLYLESGSVAQLPCAR